MIGLSLFLTGILAGSIDSIAGGGGLISLPVLFLILGPGPSAIGTNKISGTLGALVALLVYLKQGHMYWGQGLLFTAFVAIGSWVGSHLSPYIPIESFRWILAVTCPVLLFILWKKDLWIKKEIQHHARNYSVAWFHFSVAFSGLLCGVYDGAWGPGGGTFMFLALTFFAKLPLLTAMAVSKLANTFSAGTALISYASGKYVHWLEGFYLATGMSMGAFFGARHASKYAARIIRPVLATVTGLLLLKLIF